MYYTAAVLDPRIKCNLIKDQCDDPNRIITKIRAYLKEEWQKPEVVQSQVNDVELPLGSNLH
jgi:hypothetical protein